MFLFMSALISAASAHSLNHILASGHGHLGVVSGMAHLDSIIRLVFFLCLNGLITFLRVSCKMSCDLFGFECRTAPFEAKLSLLVLLLWIRSGPDKGQDDRQEDEAVSHSKDDNAKECLEHDDKDVGFGHAERDNSEEGGEATMDDTRAHLTYSNLSLVVTLRHGCIT